jgi:hypothetical protein
VVRLGAVLSGANWSRVEAERPGTLGVGKMLVKFHSGESRKFLTVECPPHRLIAVLGVARINTFKTGVLLNSNPQTTVRISVSLCINSTAWRSSRLKADSNSDVFCDILSTLVTPRLATHLIHKICRSELLFGDRSSPSPIFFSLVSTI